MAAKHHQTTKLSTMTAHKTSAGEITRRLDGAEIHGTDARLYRLAIMESKPVRPRSGWLHLTIAIMPPGGQPSRTPLMMGIVSGGGRGVMPWFECRLYPTVELVDGRVLEVRSIGLEAEFVNLLGALIPPGGHVMIEYETPGQSETHKELLLRVPPVATYLGSLMFRAGFCGEFKDWYISEGGHEGPRKLQANKSPSSSASREALRNHTRELNAFLDRPLPESPDDKAAVAQAKARARDLLREISGSGKTRSS